MAMANQVDCQGDMNPLEKQLRLGKAVPPQWASLAGKHCVGALGYPTPRPSWGSVVSDTPCMSQPSGRPHCHPLASETMMYFTCT